MITFIENEKIFLKWASKTYEYKIKNIKINKKFNYFDIDQIDRNKIDQNDPIIFGWNVSQISKYHTTKYNYYKTKIDNLENENEIYEKIKDFLEYKNKYLIVQDLHDNDYKNGINELIRYLNKYNFTGIITPYYKTVNMEKIINKCKNLRIVHLCHHIDEHQFKNRELKKKYDVFLYGNTNKNIYPKRNRIREILEQSDVKYKILKPIRNYFRYDKTKSGEALSKLINQSYLTICTESKYDMLLGKYFETAMSGSIICGSMAKDGEQIWNNNYIKLDLDKSNENIIDQIKKAIKNKNKLNKIIEYQNNIMNAYYLSSYSEKLYKLIINKLIVNEN